MNSGRNKQQPHVAASLMYVLAVRSGPFALAVVTTALFSAVTVLLARLVLAEQMRAVQRAGLVEDSHIVTFQAETE
jgi:uncharacterized membrane protein